MTYKPKHFTYSGECYSSHPIIWWIHFRESSISMFASTGRNYFTKIAFRNDGRRARLECKCDKIKYTCCQCGIRHRCCAYCQILFWCSGELHVWVSTDGWPLDREGVMVEGGTCNRSLWHIYIQLKKKKGEIRDYRNVYAEIGVSFEPGTSRTLSENYTPKPISLNGWVPREIFLTVSWATKSVK